MDKTAHGADTQIPRYLSNEYLGDSREATLVGCQKCLHEFLIHNELRFITPFCRARLAIPATPFFRKVWAIPFLLSLRLISAQSLGTGIIFFRHLPTSTYSLKNIKEGVKLGEIK